MCENMGFGIIFLQNFAARLGLLAWQGRRWKDRSSPHENNMTGTPIGNLFFIWIRKWAQKRIAVAFLSGTQFWTLLDHREVNSRWSGAFATTNGARCRRAARIRGHGRVRGVRHLLGDRARKISSEDCFKNPKSSSFFSALVILFKKKNKQLFLFSFLEGIP